ncbi:AMP-binding protein [Rhodococcus tibetensis]|uniref:AMP-binding protein n=1 Tax=Rhodococcus tibetensis TaxID=2965064 RepID=A0ABT1Q7B6_9NOCA|nr:AMP-binding protein [Rhodococcus sp. FXJ9.536]MCQ4118141.1 AMP-binding protein [Rhodococcus sp. FXJ9.536]
MIVKSPFPDVEIPAETVYDYVFGSLTAADLDRVAVVDGGRSITFAELKADIDRFAGALAARGVRPGDVVALHSPNSIGFVIAFHGILRAGATATTINVLYSPTEIAAQLRDSNASRYVTVSPVLPNAVAAADEAGLPTEHMIVLDSACGFESLASLLGEATPPPDVTVDPSALAVLPYSSGTTGRAKGVMLTHSNLVANIAQCTPMLRITSDDAVSAVLPFFHIYGMNVIMNLTLRQRGKLVTLPKFDLPEFLRQISAYECTYLFIAPPVAVALAKHPIVEQFDVSSVRVIVCGAAPLDEALGNALMARLQCRLLQGFGMTELSPVSHVTPIDDPDISIGSIGVAVPNIEFKIVDPETGTEITYVEGARSRPGEMLVRGPGVMHGYLGNPEATAATIEPNGFLHTGDIVEVGPKGEVYVVDRLKELIKYKGYQVPPAELEALLLTHPAIADAAVVPYPDTEAGEIPRAFIVTQPGAEVFPDEILDYVAARVAPHKRIRMLEFIDAVPKSLSGKILRKDLKGRPVAQ